MRTFANFLARFLPGGNNSFDTQLDRAFADRLARKRDVNLLLSQIGFDDKQLGDQFSWRAGQLDAFGCKSFAQIAGEREFKL